jgi:folate-binding protein YgfZ
MNPSWQAFLSARGASPVADGSASDGAAAFSHAAADTRCALTDLSHLGLIAVGGPEAADFLQGQVTNDVRELSATHTQLNSHCSPKGRMLASFRLLRIDETLYLLLPRSRVDALQKRLGMFKLRAKVSIDDASDALVCFGVIGHCADEVLAGQFGALPQGDNDMVRAGDAVLIRTAGELPRYLFIGPATDAQALWQAAAAQGAVEAHPDLWALHDIRAGIPSVLPETADAFVPQMANLHLIDGVSFHKGCYSGQEVVARMQYLGKLKRRMYIAEAETGQAPKPGDALGAAGSSSEQGPGRVVDARASAPGRWELLVVAEIAAAEGGELRLGDDGPVLKLRAPAYGFGDAA